MFYLFIRLSLVCLLELRIIFLQCAHKIFLKRKVTNEGLFEPGKIPVHEHTLKLTNNRPELLIKDISYPKQSGPLGN